jgi:hypothetical protein
MARRGRIALKEEPLMTDTPMRHEQLSKRARMTVVMDAAVAFIGVLTSAVRDSPSYFVAVRLVENARNEAMAAIEGEE